MSEALDYYGYRPLLRLDRPLALCGLPGAQVGQTVRVVSMLSGLQMVRVDRNVEHVLGRSFELELAEAGSARILAAEGDVLRRVVAAPTPPVVALSDVTFTDPDLRALVQERMRVVHLSIAFDEALDRIARASGEDRKNHYALLQGGAFDREAVLARLRFFARLYREVADTLEVGSEAPLVVGQAVLGRLGLDLDPRARLR